MVEAHLKKLFYEDFKSPSFYTGSPQVLLQEYNKKNSPKINIKRVDNFLQKQAIYGLHKNKIEKFPRNKIMTEYIGDILALDLADMGTFEQHNNGFKFILFAIDTFSKKGYTCELKEKTASQTLDAFKKIKTKIDYSIKNIMIDDGSEFKGVFKKWCFENNINLFIVDGETKNSICERFIRTIKERLWRYIKKKGIPKWREILPKIIISYNTTKHRTIKMAPNDVNNGNSHIVYKTMFPKRFIKYPPKFHRGDIVRHSIDTRNFRKPYEGRYTLKVFRIRKIKYNPRGKYPLYILEDVFTSKKHPGSWYQQQLVKVDEKTFSGKKTFYDIHVLQTKGNKMKVEYVGYDGPPVWVKKQDIIHK